MKIAFYGPLKDLFNKIVPTIETSVGYDLGPGKIESDWTNIPESLALERIAKGYYSFKCKYKQKSISFLGHVIVVKYGIKYNLD